jgi:hypothetical protein
MTYQWSGILNPDQRWELSIVLVQEVNPLSGDVAKGMTGPQCTLVDELINENPLMSAYGSGDSTRQYGLLGVDVALEATVIFSCSRTQNRH